MLMSNTSSSKFRQLGVQKWLIDQGSLLNIVEPTPVQTACIPKILNGYNCIGCAKTGSGKTAAFAFPILQKFSEDPYGIYALILTPTRELAYQIADHFLVLGKPVNLKVLVIVGGNDMMLQGKDLSYIPHIVISTPGRLVDHIETYRDLNFSRLKFLVMDEADRLLEGYFNDQLKTILGLLSKQRQNLVFSATFNETLQALCLSNSVKSPFIWKDNFETVTVDTLEQYYLPAPFLYKESYLLYVMLDFLNTLEDTLINSKMVTSNKDTGLKSHFQTSTNSLAIIFTNSCKKCQVIHTVLKRLGVSNLPIHSNLTQKQRLVALTKFKSGQVRILVATDLASRGLDIPLVDLVFNHSLPKSPEDYVHRVGRTARAGRPGMAITMISPPKDVPVLQSIEKHIGVKMQEYKSMNERIIMKFLTEVTVIKRECQIDIENSEFDTRIKINQIKRKLLQGDTLTEDERKLCSGIKKIDKIKKEKNERPSLLQTKSKIKIKKPSL